MRRLSLVLSSLLVPCFLMAHGAEGHPFVAGFTHPIFGIDHLLAIMAFSIIGHHLMTEKPWLLSILFALSMVVGAFLGQHADPYSFTELVIQASVVIGGILIWGKFELTLVGFALLSILFGFVHGHAHGTEMPEDANFYIYTLGFVLGVGVISVLGYVISRIFTNGLGIRSVGAFITGMGAAMMLP
jgi:Hydrogenase/urease accessory protein